MQFRIEYIFERERPAYLFARQIEAGEFSVSANSRLGGVLIKPYVSQPRALTPGGEPDLKVFTFFLATANDLPRLKIGQVVQLTEDVP